MGTFVKLKSADENTSSRKESEKTSAKSSTGGKFIKIGEPTFKKSYSTEQKAQTERHSTTPEYDISGEAWTRATPSQTKIPSKEAGKPRNATLYDMTIGSIKRGYDNAVYGRELYKQMTGQENEADEYAEKMQGEDYNFEAGGLVGRAVSGAAELIGQQVRQWTDPLSLALAGTAATGAAIAGQAGPQVLVPEEVITVPAAFGVGLTTGSAKANFEIEAGHAYQELLDNGVSESTAKIIATGVGAGNAALEFVQLDELAKSFKVLDKIGADDTILGAVKKELARRGVDIAKETVQEVAQEGVTIAGTQIGSKLDKGEWAYGADDVLSRLGDTALSSALSFGMMNVPGGAYNVYQQTGNKRTAKSSGPSVEYQDAPGAPNELLVQAAEQVAQNGTISGKMADRILADDGAMAYLQQAGVLDFSDGMKQTERRSAVKSSVERLASITTDTERTEAGTDTQNQQDALMRAIGDGQRVDYDALTEEQIAAWNGGHDDVWVDADYKVYQMDPAQHISQRTADGVSSRTVNAFQFDHPELRPYYKQAASDLIKDASLSLDQPKTGHYERTTQGKRYVQNILESQSLRNAMDMGLTRGEIIQAAEALVADHGQENYAAAKRLEFVLDDMLTSGYTTVEGETFGPNEDYIQMVQRIPGYQAQELEELPIWDMDEAAATKAQAKTPQAPVLTARARNDAEIAYDIQQVQRAASALGENGSRALSAVYDADMARYYDPQDVTESFFQVYNAALNGEKLTADAERRSAAMPEHLRLAAQSSAEQDAVRAEQAKYFGDKAGLVRDANWKKAHLSSKTSRVLDALGKVLGVEVRFAETVNDGQANAMYENGVITIALDAQDPVLTSLVHEIVHRVREASPGAYQTLADFVRQNMTEEGMDFNLAQREHLYKTTDTDYLTEEMVADAFGRMLGNEEIMGRFAQEHRTLAQRVHDALSDIINAIKRVLGRQNLKLTENQRAAFRDLDGRVSAMERTFVDALKEAGKSSANKNITTQQDGDAKFSIKRTKDMTLSEQLKAFYDGKLRPSDALYFGETPDALAAAGLDQLPLVFTQSDFKKSTKSKHNVPRRVLKNLNKDLETALLAFGDGDRVGILTGDIDGDGKPLLVGIERNVTMDWQQVNAIRSAYGLDNPGAWLKNQIEAGKTLSLLDENRANTFLLPYGYLASRGEGIRSMGESVTQDGGEVKSKFSLKAPVEETKNLLAIHNKDEASILSALELGGLPMPSIAVVKAADGHSQYGPISLVFSKDTIDPQADRRNKVYGSDAWTPTHSDARVDYEVDYDVKREFEQNIETLAKDVAGGTFSQSSVLDMAGVGDQTSMSVEEIAHRLATRYDSVRAAYLANKGRDIDIVYRAKEFDSFGNDALKSYLDKVGEQEAARLAAKMLTGERLSAAEVETVKDSIMESWTAKNEWRLNKKPELRETRIAKQREKLSDLRAEDFARNAWDFYEDGGTTTDEVNRMETAENLRHAVDDKAVEAWVLDMLRGLTGEPGIYNGSEMFDARGNRKSFKETHWSYTLENIVRAMNNAKTRGQGMWGMSGSGLVATATPAYNSVQEMHADESRLRSVDNSEYEQMVKDLDGELGRVASDIMHTTEHHASNTFEEEEIIGDVIAMAAQGKRTTAGVKQTFRKEGYTISDKQASAVLGLIEHASRVPTGYFEAKPQRAVGFDEVLAAIIPDDSSEKLRAGLERAGVRMLEYKSGDDADRLAKVNSVEGARFSLKTDSQGRTLTEQQREYFKDSKAVDDQGRLMVMYHGTRKGGFTVFRDWSYLTANRKYAERYMDRDTGETMYEVYANIKKPFDTRLEECRTIWENEFYGEYSRTALQESGLPDWTDGYDLVDFLEENGYDYDAILLDEGADQVNGSIVERGISYVVRSSEQIKSITNENPTSDPDIRYSLKEDSHGNMLTEQQQRYFQDSKITDNDGRLMVMYHGTTAYGEITKFRKGRSGWLGPGIYLSSRKADAQRYADAMGEGNGSLYELYANVTKPLVVTQNNPVPEILLAAYGRESVYKNRSAKQGNDTHIITPADIKKLQSKGYDGIRWDFGGNTELSVFSSEQLKRVDNTSPTGSQDIRYSLKPVPPVRPKSKDWRPGVTFDEVKTAHPTLFALDADEADTRNPTQISGTVKSYRKIYDALKAEGFDGTILDASSGLGYGTRAGREEYGFQVDDIEPFPDEKYKPMFTDYSTLDKTYDVIINNAVLNVMPQDLRDALVVKMGEMLKPGGRAFINVRGTDVKNASSKVAINDDLMEYFISNTGSYQKGFTQRELVAYLKDALGDGFSVEPTKKFGGVSAIVTRDIRYSRSDRDILDAYVKEYGAIPRGEKPSREIVLPKKTAGGKNLSQTVRTILEAGATPDEIVPNIEKLAAKGDFSYDAYTDKQAVADAEANIRRVGWAQALSDWMGNMKRGEVSKANTAMGWALYNNAANTGDTNTAITILERMVEHQRNAAQALQATRILKKLSPETQLYGVQRSVANLQEELNERYGEKGGPELKVDNELAERFLQAKDQETRDEVLKDIYRDIGRQMPSRFRDKWNAWRYLAMLGNPRTHVRNVVGNAGFAPVVATKNALATTIEAAVSRVSGGKLERSKGLVLPGKKGRALLEAAWNDYAKAQETALGGGKYSDFSNANKYVEEGRRIFKTKPLEAARKANSAALEAEDVWFSKPHYAYALAQYCKAHNITPEQIATGKGLKQARSYAVLEAQKATYRDTNALSQTISEIGRSIRPGRNPVRKGVSLVMEGILPFRKTPANILARGMEYSPIGLMNGIKQAVWDVQKGKKTGAEAIDSISAGLTGTGLLALGAWLAAQGLVRGHGGGDEDENELEELMGHQAYALELPNGTSVTLDWLAPEALPFFVGVNLWEQTGGEQEEVTLSSILSAVSTVSEPMLEMSCLQSLNDVFDAVGYASSEGLDGLPAALASAATSYLTQGLPTILGQAERTGEDKRYTTYTEKNSFLTGDMQYTLGRASARIPGWDYQQIPYIDAWGRVEQSGNTGARAFNNFLNPAYTSTINEGEVEAELLRLYEATGESGVLPSRARKYFTVDKERKDLTAEEYVQYAMLKGQTSHELVTELTQSGEYQSMSDEEKVKAVKDAYDLANQSAKEAVSGYKPDAWIGKAAEAEKKYGISQETYITLKTQAAGIQSLKDADGETISNSNGLQIMEMVYNTPGLTDKQRSAMFEYLGVGKSVRHYNKALVSEKLAQMRKQAG